MVGGACVTVTLLMCVAGSQALDLLRAAAASGSEYHSLLFVMVHGRCFQEAGHSVKNLTAGLV